MRCERPYRNTYAQSAETVCFRGLCVYFTKKQTL